MWESSPVQTILTLSTNIFGPVQKQKQEGKSFSKGIRIRLILAKTKQYVRE